MASKSRFIWGIALIVAAVAGALIFAQLRRKPALRVTIDDVQPATPGAGAAGAGGAPAQRDPRAAIPRPEAPAGEPATTAGTGGAAEQPPAAEGSPIGPQLPIARKWKLEGTQKQLALYRKQVDANMRALEKLGATIERVKREGATAEQIEQIQRRLQQMRAADTRMRLRLQELERELAAHETDAPKE